MCYKRFLKKLCMPNAVHGAMFVTLLQRTLTECNYIHNRWMLHQQGLLSPGGGVDLKSGMLRNVCMLEIYIYICGHLAFMPN